MGQVTFNFTGTQVVVTGGSRGIGAAIVRTLAHAGATVLFNDSKGGPAAAALVAELGTRVRHVVADLSTAQGVNTLVESVKATFGSRVDVLVNNAGVYIGGALDQTPVEDLLRQQRINVEAPLLLTRALLPVLVDGGRVINVGSAVGEKATYGALTAYGSTKGAILMFTRGLARELAPRRITANVVQPGPVDTDMNPDTPENTAADMMKRMIALGRYGTAQEVADAVAFLASDRAAYITGTTLTVDGGHNA